MVSGAVGDKQVVLILCGGRSAEHEISLLSARFIASSLDRVRFDPLLVGIDKEGKWHALDAIPEGDANDVRIDLEAARAWIQPMPHDPPLLHVTGRSSIPFDVAFPMLHGPLGEDGSIQGLFELANVPYVGSGVAGSAVGMDKVMQKRLLGQAGISTLPFRALSRSDWDRDSSAVLASCAELSFPLFVKPANMGSSLGISRVDEETELAAAIRLALEFDQRVLVEQGLDAPREIELSVLGNEDAIVSCAGEIVVSHSDGFYSYDAKYLSAEGAELCVPAQLAESVAEELQLLALRSYRALDCAGMARVDLFVKGDETYVNELNTIPGFTSISMYPRLWAASGIGATELVTRLIDLALARHRARAGLRTTR